MITKRITCIVCPYSCSVEVDFNKEMKIIEVRNNKCKQGLDYASVEAIFPKRTITTTVKVKNHNNSLVSVRSLKPIPKNKIFQAMEILKNIEIPPPVHIYDIIVKNIANTGVDVIATRDAGY